ncbi:SDR family NAD(P)-dependent oxidoreductase [Dactylosporangium matsuzakiense]|uniref:Short-chain dehydrogenase n=1 Tax=Dactylosporangium matsuzakiense TaxID=53360 RepID=A0A9W6KDV0_9ACTN|nr:SDR family NAD(P)-dependent oxidoreductase [Dactylosporangium matsuzakiense]UWZ47105.1 SDR family NAD(P)-dependent oxidoreductase [Dactylosporangium matsuzakiense]GLK98460.1 short-chain dehydrogenase [Dactylosporangium matsuzakiense]
MSAVVTGGGRGLGRAYSLALAAAGHAVVVNDLGDGPAAAVVAEIEAAGGTAVASTHDVTDFAAAAGLVGLAVERFGALDVVVANAGILRDRTLASMGEAEWDDVIAVHLKGTFAVAHHAAAHWRARAKAGGPVDARLITTTSASGLYGNIGQSNYAAAKAGIAGFSLVAAQELRPYGVSVNCVAPSALTRLTEAPLLRHEGAITDERRHALDPSWVARVVAWLCGPDAADITGRVFDIRGPQVGIASGWHLEPTFTQPDDPGELGRALRAAVAAAPPAADMEGRRNG